MFESHMWRLGLGFRVWGLRFRVWGLGFRVWGLGFRVWGLRFRVFDTPRVRARHVMATGVI
jgi:hypothetical protein